MHTIPVVSLLAVLVCVVPATGRAQSRPDVIALTQQEEHIRLTVAPSKLELLIPKMGFVPSFVGNGPQGPRYFMLTDASAKVSVSGWFEPAARYKGAEKLWTSSPEAGLAGSDVGPSNVRFAKVGSWETVAYEQPSVKTAYLRAHWTQSGTWLELRLSTGTGSPEEQAKALAELLARFEVREKSQ